jgi:hypothetical protein
MIADDHARRCFYRDKWAAERKAALLEDRLEMKAYRAQVGPSITESQFLETLWRAQLERLGECR